MPSKETRKHTIVDLFCGPGGLSAGFEAAGFEISLANDIDASSILTYKKNRPNLSQKNAVLGDIDQFIQEKGAELQSGKFSVVIGGPPCQGFSMANRQRLIADPRNILYKKFVQVIHMSKPDFFVMENVKGMLPYAQQVIQDFEAVGYWAHFQLFNMKDFGIPQNRERVLYIGANKKHAKSPDQLIKDIFEDIERQKSEKLIPLREIFWGLRKISARSKKGDTSIESAKSGLTEDIIIGSEKPNEYILRINHGKIPKKIFNHKARYNNPRDLEIFRLLPPGEKSDHPSIAHIMPYKRRENIFKDKYFKLHPDKISKTITSHMKFDCNMYIHPVDMRGITPREAARIQSFPDHYIFEGSYSKWYSQIGNAVPPLFGEIIARSIMRKLV